jgi:hypothetical protein
MHRSNAREYPKALCTLRDALNFDSEIVKWSETTHIGQLILRERAPTNIKSILPQIEAEA